MPIPKETYQKYIRLKAWNEYAIAYYNLSLEKKTDTDYLSIHIWLGRFCVFKYVSTKVTKLTPLDAHEKLHRRLLEFRAAISTFGVTYVDANFKPPEL